MEKKLTPEQAAKVEEGMNLWRGKPESKTKAATIEISQETYNEIISKEIISGRWYRIHKERYCRGHHGILQRPTA
jgi:hypothetical protein